MQVSNVHILAKSNTSTFPDYDLDKRLVLIARRDERGMSFAPNRRINTLGKPSNKTIIN